MSQPTQVITSPEITMIRTEQERFMDQSAVIKRKVMTSEDIEEEVEINTWCAVKPGFGFFRGVADRYKTGNPHILKFPWNTVLKLEDRVVIDGTEFLIKEVNDKGSWRTLVEALGDRQ